MSELSIPIGSLLALSLTVLLGGITAETMMWKQYRAQTDIAFLVRAGSVGVAGLVTSVTILYGWKYYTTLLQVDGLFWSLSLLSPLNFGYAAGFSIGSNEWALPAAYLTVCGSLFVAPLPLSGFQGLSVLVGLLFIGLGYLAEAVFFQQSDSTTES